MGRSPCCEKVGLKKGPWTPEEDQKLVAFIEQYGHGSWRALPAKAGLQRCGKSCRLRWTNYLRPDIKRGKFNLQEEQTIIQLHALLGNRWSAIATHLPKRTDNEIKNYWNTHLKKRLTKMGIDPVTHKPKSDALGPSHAKNSANLSHMAQWESARLEAEARLVRESKLVQPNLNPIPSTPLSTSTLAQRATTLPPPLPCLDVLKAWQGAWTSNPTTQFSPTNTGSTIMCYNFSGDDLESPTSTLNFINPIQIESSMMCGIKHAAAVLGLQGLASYPVTTTDFNLAWELEDHHAHDNNIVPDMFGFNGLDQGSVMLGGHNNNNIDINNINNNEEDMCNNGNLDGGGEFEDNKNYWDSILNMVTTSPSESTVF